MNKFLTKSSTGSSESRESDGSAPIADRAAKRLKAHDVQSSDDWDDEDSNISVAEEDLAQRDCIDREDIASRSAQNTALESALLPAGTQEEAEEAYKEFQSSQVKDEDDTSEPKNHPLWMKGRRSIYVDAFSLALDTVLEEEAQLFNERELNVFYQWKALEYESQYLYVRLFLRKTAAWHRCNKLGYYNDISDPDAAIENLQKVRHLPTESSPPQSQQLPLSHGIETINETLLSSTVTFADSSAEKLTSVRESANLLLLDELKLVAKELKVQGKNKSDLITALCKTSQQQRSLRSLGVSRQNSDEKKETSEVASAGDNQTELPPLSSQEHLVLYKISTILGPCIRLSEAVFKLFERVHLVFYRSTEWTEKSLTTIILAKIARRNFPQYLVCRSSTIFASRSHLVEFETAIRLEADVDGYLEGSGATFETGCEKILELFETMHPRWKNLIEEETDKERNVYDVGEGAYLRRFNPAHSYTRILSKCAHVFGRRKYYDREHSLLVELLNQRLFHVSRRGGWYQRKALLEEHYMAKLGGEPCSGTELERQKKKWYSQAAKTCENGLQDPDCHLIYHFELQKRLQKLEKRLRIPRRLQHDFAHVRLAKPLEIVVQGIQIKRDIPIKPGAVAAPTRTLWLDELDTQEECTVEEMCLSYFRSQGWKGYHAEGGITAYQTCPLDLHTDAFMTARMSEINHRLVEIANGEGETILRSVWEREHNNRTAVIGLNWDFAVEDLAELVRCFEGSALAAVCKVMAQEYRQRGGGIPDLILWQPVTDADGEADSKKPLGKAQGQVMFGEVKSENDRLSETQRLWIHVLTGAGIQVALVHAAAKEVREVY